MAKTVSAMWSEFNARVIPPEASAVQQSEMRKAFYAGFVQAICALNEIAVQNSEETACSMVDELFKECAQFFGVRSGGA